MSEIKNRRAFFDFEILQKFSAGIVLFGPEVKSLRAGHGNLRGSFVSVRNGEAFLKNFEIPVWKFCSEKINPTRDRKLLLRKKEILKLEKKIAETGKTIVPLRIFFSHGFIKIEIALATGNKKFDKREKIKKRDLDRKISIRIKNNF